MHNKRYKSKPYRHRQQHLAFQAQLFGEVIEFATTRDEQFEAADGSWGSRINKPAGQGWRVIDSYRERHTKWIRRRPIPWALRSSVGD